MPEHEWGSPVERFTNPVLAGMERVDDHECFRIEATFRSDHDPWTIWIDRESFLIRRVGWVSHLRNPVHNTMTLAPLEDPEIPLTAFEFAPPE